MISFLFPVLHMILFNAFVICGTLHMVIATWLFDLSGRRRSSKIVIFWNKSKVGKYYIICFYRAKSRFKPKHFVALGKLSLWSLLSTFFIDIIVTANLECIHFLRWRNIHWSCSTDSFTQRFIMNFNQEYSRL